MISELEIQAEQCLETIRSGLEQFARLIPRLVHCLACELLRDEQQVRLEVKIEFLDF